MDADPSLILVMRHAEKSLDPADPDLSPAGEARAQALATYIPQTFEPLDFLYAAAISKHSARPYETVKPLSLKTGIPINSTIADNDYAFLASQLLSVKAFAKKRILICWHHGNIPPLMHALRALSGSFPNPWDPTVFNLLLKLDYPPAEPRVTQITEPF